MLDFYIRLLKGLRMVGNIVWGTGNASKPATRSHAPRAQSTSARFSVRSLTPFRTAEKCSSGSPSPQVRLLLGGYLLERC